VSHHNLKIFRRFVLNRSKDESGISGTGIVAEGLQFSSKKCVISWLSDTPSIEIYDSIEEVRRIHGHQGETQIKWIDGSD
jgi:hypothetical protein